MPGTHVLSSGAEVKIRRPWAVAALSLVPFYWCVWYYRVNREMRDYGRTRADRPLASSRPGLSILAVTLGSLVVVPALVSRWRAVRRMQACERFVTLGDPSADALLVVVLVSSALGVIPAIVGVGLVWIATAVASTALVLATTFAMQRRLNEVWLDSV